MILTITNDCRRSIGPVEIGMPQGSVRAALGVGYKPFKRTETVEISSDYYESEGLFIYYKPPGVVEAVEIAKPSIPVYRGVRLLDQAFEEIARALRSEDPNILMEPNGLVSKLLGIAVYAPEVSQDSKCKAESVTVFGEAYYD